MPNNQDIIESFYPKKLTDWQEWLDQHHQSKDSVWLIFYKKKTEIDSISWSEAVDVALCYGWIDSKKQTIDEQSYRQIFSKRKANSMWSKVNKTKVDQLIKEGRMQQAGYDSIAIAKENGSWTMMDHVENLEIPDDLEAAFNQHPEAQNYFEALSKSAKKVVLHRLAFAKRTETRQKRIAAFLTEVTKQA